MRNYNVSNLLTITRNTCIAEPREARGRGGGSPKGVGGQERNEVNHVTGGGGLILEAEMYLISCGLNLNLVFWL